MLLLVMKPLLLPPLLPGSDVSLAHPPPVLPGKYGFAACTACWCFTGHMQSFSQQPAPCSAKNSPKKMVAGSVRQVFCLCPVQNSVRGRDSACPEAHLQLSQFNLLCSRRYVLSTFFQRLQEGSFLQYAYDPVSTSLVCKR